MIDQAIADLVQYALDTGLVEEADRVWAINGLLEDLGLSDWEEVPGRVRPLEEILGEILDWAVAQGRIEDGTTSRDLFDTKLMGRLTPRPAQVRAAFAERYARSPEEATDWYYQFSQNTDYIRRYRVARDQKWIAHTDYGDLEITINLSKPEKDPRAIAAARSAPQGGYPKCLLCRENEGYAGRMNHPARQNHRLIPVTIDGKDWFFQYSPYVYYNEHCIVFNGQHVPMKIDRSAFRKLLDFVKQFPHYFVGSNADLPIVGGSIQTHDHFQGGRYTFPMERAGTDYTFSPAGFPDVSAAVVHWPLSVIRLRGADKERVALLADRILELWRAYSDPEAQIFANTDGEPHSTITPIARRRGTDYELDLALRNNLTTEEHPLGLYHPHQEIHHIKRETIGLIEVMGLAILPPRLKGELAAVEEALLRGRPLEDNPLTAPHAQWGERLRETYGSFQADTVHQVLLREVGLEFTRGLEHAGVYKCTPEGRAAFRRFTDLLTK